ncbi:elongation factor P--(R)-beta-lysine ligase [Hydrogenobacter thermophilus]|uniref:elongation factor P--(R)-beta-lysine ligase n=1 Tax=Hydrogenobacter thermophilus TaxID=940 RepID=UPI0030FB3E8E
MLLKEWSLFIDSVRSFFKDRGYLEVHTSIFQKYPNIDPHVEPFSLELSGNCPKRVWLRTSPENSMKKLISKYRTDMFQIGKVFRRDPCSKIHRPEFTMLEWYRIGKDYNYLIQEIGDLLKYLGVSQDYEIIRLEHAFEEYTGVVLSEDEEIFKNNLISYGYPFKDDEDWESIFYEIYIQMERHLGKEKPTFLTHFPTRLSAYAKVEGGYAERFELYIKGVEIANGWTEETSRSEIERRMKLYLQGREMPMDEELLKAYEDFPECAGCSIGLERLFLVLKGFESMDDLEFLI